MIVFNEMPRCLVVENVFLMPGSNVVENIDLENEVVKAWIDSGDIRIENKVSENVAVEAINKANLQNTIEAIEKQAPKNSERVKNAAKGRKKILDDFDAEVAAAIEKNKKQAEELGEGEA